VLTWHGGAILPTAVTGTVFWGTSWANSSFVGDKITGLDNFYTAFNGSNYAKTSDEYTGSNGQVGQSTSYVGHVIDTSPASSSTSAVLAEAAKAFPNPDPNGNGYYAVYIDLPRGNATFCSYHSFGTTPNGQTIQFAFFFNLDGDAGCDPRDTTTGHSQGLAALANRSGAELSGARTNPRNGGWYDSAGLENHDKCAWTFNVPSVTFADGIQWKLQGEWSNNAFNTNTGYPNSAGQRGCLDGH
jgi:hypothetical protein